MKKGMPEMLTFILALIMPGVAVRLTPEKSYAYLLFFVVIAVAYIALKKQERREANLEKSV